MSDGYRLTGDRSIPTPRNTTCQHGVMTGPDIDGEECVDCATEDVS